MAGADNKLTIKDLTRGIFRRLYAGFIHGKRINSVSIGAEHWFWRLIAVADDFGNFRAGHENLRIEASPKRKVTARQVGEWMAELVGANLIVLYDADGDPFGHVVQFVELQPEFRGANGKGKRTRRVPEWQGETLGSTEQVDPDYPGGSQTPQARCAQTPQSYTHNHNQQQHQAKAAAGCADAENPGGETRAALAALGIGEPTLTELASSTLLGPNDVPKALKGKKGIGATVNDLRGLVRKREKERAAAVVVADARAWGQALPGDKRAALVAQFRFEREDHCGAMTPAQIFEWSIFWTWVAAKKATAMKGEAA